ncbi:DUF2877 domain-containing protein [Bacillus sp. FJAT-27245]|uniref:DUF2877 domain-containing protein n=1 Tax=Bacillus sp. FJAT-27245 TaxID=1684144 RepID=UPI0006A7E699|nr:DUF2877 domain-containing protein [Bacillus sp. FJAT-27245]
MIYSMRNNNNQDTSRFAACAFSDEIFRIVERNPRGCVHSIFNNSFNLVFGEHLVHVGAVENGLSPFGIGLNQHDVRQLTLQLRSNQDVAWDLSSNTLFFSDRTSLSFETAEMTNHTLHGCVSERQHVKENFLFIAERLLQEEWRTGLAETTEDKVAIVKYMVEPAPYQKELLTLHQLDSLKKLANGNKAVEAENVFNYWIGRGLGLTPSGDDVITGICAVFSAMEGTNKAFQQQLKRYLLENGRKRTTQIALEYLLYATENKFHSHLIQLCTVLDKPRSPEFSIALEEMRKIGHTSGADTIIGILLGIKASIK